MKREQDDLDRGFGEGSKLHLPGRIAVLAAQKAGEKAEDATIMLFGEAERVEAARDMLLELVDNKEQKQAQRQKVRGGAGRRLAASAIAAAAAVQALAASAAAVMASAVLG